MTNKYIRWGAILLLAVIVNAAYLSAFATASIFYVANVLLHLALGCLLLIPLGFFLARENDPWGRAAAVVLALSAIPAFYLVRYGALNEHREWLFAHVNLAKLAAVLFAFYAVRRYPRFGRALAASVVLLLAVPLGLRVKDRFFPNRVDYIRNPPTPPASMDGEGAGPRGHFWPSSAVTNVGLIPSDYFLDSKHCGTCHKDIYEQWKSSMHHFASFNNQFYRKAIEYMQAVQGATKPSRWCAGCHDHAVLFNGRWEKPISEQIDTPEAQAGLGCMSCHAIAQVHDTMGNASYTMDYNWLHKLASNKNKWVQDFEYFVTYLNPKPHRRNFLKPFHRQNSAEFCASCHKVHLDVPVNNYRWIRGFNDYDNWQASGVSGRGARSFYYPKESLTCNGCHMPLVDSRDPGNIDGKVHSHRFAAANTAVPYINNDTEQLKATRDFLESGFISVDIFSASPVEDAPPQLRMMRRAGEQAQTAMSTFAVGEEAETAGQVFLREVGKVAAPLNRPGVKLVPGETARVDVVVRTKRIGHFFPGGTVDAFDIWLELEGLDASGRHIFWSGCLEEEGGPVEKGAHFYRAFLLDGAGNPINKRNAWSARSVLYVRLIPPGAADTAHFRVRVPKDAKGPITLRAKLNYRKFSHYYTQFAFAGQPRPRQDPSLVNVHYDNREFFFDPRNIPANVSSSIRGKIPELPIITLARDEVLIPLAAPGEKVEWKPHIQKEDYERWNDWGIGMLLQGDLKGAEYAFEQVMAANPSYADGPLNAARALIQEGETDAAKPLLERAKQLNPKLARIHFFDAMVKKADGDYDGAIASLRLAEAQYPEDRVVLNQLGRLYFLKRQYADSVKLLERVMRVDPEDLQAHYNLMLAYRGLGDNKKAEQHAILFKRFKADEASQELTAKPRLLSPEDNNERQPIHEHESAPLEARR